MLDTTLIDTLSTGSREVAVLTADDFRLGATVFEPEGAISGNVLIHGATAAPQRYYRRFAAYLASGGLRVITYDYRGTGRSRPRSLPQLRASMDDWALWDARAMHAYVSEHHGGLPLSIVGHSFGGQLVGLLDEAREAQAAVFVGAQLGYYGNWPKLSALGLAAIWHGVVPAATAVFGYLPGQLGLGEDLPFGVARQWARWCTNPDYLMRDHPEARERYERFAPPTLFYSFTDDALAPRRAVTKLLDHLPAERLRHRRLAPRDLNLKQIGHFGFFRPQLESSLWREARDFLALPARLADA